MATATPGNMIWLPVPNANHLPPRLFLVGAPTDVSDHMLWYVDGDGSLQTVTVSDGDINALFYDTAKLVTIAAPSVFRLPPSSPVNVGDPTGGPQYIKIITAWEILVPNGARNPFTGAVVGVDTAIIVVYGEMLAPAPTSDGSVNPVQMTNTGERITIRYDNSFRLLVDYEGVGTNAQPLIP
jgi:hypothetical protein